MPLLVQQKFLKRSLLIELLLHQVCYVSRHQISLALPLLDRDIWMKLAFLEVSVLTLLSKHVLTQLLVDLFAHLSRVKLINLLLCHELFTTIFGRSKA